VRPRPADYIQPGERVLLQQRRHPLSVLDELVAIVLLWGVLAGGGVWLVFLSGLRLVPEFQTALLVAMAVLTLGAAWLAGYRLLRMLTSLYTVTDQRVYEAHGRFWFHLLQTTYDRVTDTHVRQSPFGRLCGFGTVTLQTAGTGLPLTGIRDPLAIKQQVEEARSRFVASLRRAPAPATAPAPGRKASRTAQLAPPGAAVPLPDAQVWLGRPSVAWLGVSLLAAAPFLVVGGVLLVIGLLTLPPLLFAGGLMAFMGVVTLVRILIVYGTSRYEVRTHGLVVSSGWLGRRRVETTYEKVTDLETQQSIPGRVFGYGTIRINTAGGSSAPVAFVGIADPETVKSVVSQARAARLGGA
jgi:membrane protein YdbS with pleckstrin-like domain